MSYSNGSVKKFYSNNFYSKPYNSGNLFAKKEFLDQISETTKLFDLKKRPLPGPIQKTDIDIKRHSVKNMKVFNEDTKIMIQNIEKRDLFCKSERKLWKSEEWRRRDKNVGNNFNKLSPIQETGTVSD